MTSMDALQLLHRRVGRHLSRADVCPRDAHKAAEIMVEMARQLREESQRSLRLDEVSSRSPARIVSVEGDSRHFRVLWPHPGINDSSPERADWEDAHDECLGRNDRPWSVYYPKEDDARMTYLLGTFLETIPGYALTHENETVNVIAGKRDDLIQYEVQCPRHATENDQGLVIGVMENAMVNKLRRESGETAS